MKKIAYLLSVYLFCLLPKLQAQDIDFSAVTVGNRKV